VEVIQLTLIVVQNTFSEWLISECYDHHLMDLREIGWGGMDWIELAQDRDQWRALMNTVVNLRIP
jgi:hypothetical protein